MNFENLHELINRYENDLPNIYGEKHFELFKWRAVKAWQDAFKLPNHSGTFGERFSEAKKEFSVFIDNSREHPSTGILKLWEKEPETIEHLFRDVLFADPAGDVSKVKEQMNMFQDEYEGLRQKYYPRSWSYKQNPHTASVFLAMNDPEFNYVYRYGSISTMARYIDFDGYIGSGSSLDLVNYYRMCDTIVSALREHETLLEKHFSYLTDKMYNDQSLHLLAFDLMYCSKTYGYYTGLVPSAIGTAKKRKDYSGPSAEELAQKEQERLERIADLEQRINELESSIDDFEDISLLGVEVSFPKYGEGTIVGQEVNKINVQFAEIEKEFVLDKAYTMRPRFENDDEIVDAFTVYGQTKMEIEKLKKQLGLLQQ